MDYPLARTGWWAGACVSLGVLALGATLGWWAWHGRVDGLMTEPGALSMVVTASVAAAGFVAWRWQSLRRRPHSRLRWDGARWELLAAGGQWLHLNAPAVQIDLGAALLLRASPCRDGRVRWLPLQRRDQPAAWHAVRVALFQRGPARTTPEAAP